MTDDRITAACAPAAGLDPQATFNAFVQRATAERAVLGLVLFGSQAHAGMATARSDYDLLVVVDDDLPADLLGLDGFRSAHLDLVVLGLARMRGYALPGDPEHWARYAFAHSRVLLDRADGLITQFVARLAVLGEQEAWQRADDYLDAYVNSVYRSLKSHRDGRGQAGHLDAAESVPYLLTVLFALHRRVRPYNKYLLWELERSPLGDPCWEAGVLLARLRRILTEGDPATQRAVFADVERAARRAGHDRVLDAWGSDLDLLRPSA